MLKCRARKAPVGVQDGVLGVHPVHVCILNDVPKPASAVLFKKGAGVTVLIEEVVVPSLHLVTTAGTNVF